MTRITERESRPRNRARTRLAVISSHPIQYNAPLFKGLAQSAELDLKVFYSWEGTSEQDDPEFAAKITWDIPLLEGYDYCFSENLAKDPGTHHFGGLDCPRLVETIEAWKPTTILVYGWAFKAHLSVLRHFHRRIPVFFRGDSTLLTGGSGLRRPLRRAGLRWVYGHIDHALYVGQRNKAYFLRYGLKERQLDWVPHSVDNRRFAENGQQHQEEADRETRRLGIPENALKLMFAGKFVPRKMPKSIIDAVIRLNAQKEDEPIHLIMVGEGPLRQSLVDRACGYDFIHICGFKNQRDMPIVYRMADVFLLPSSIETWGLAVNEAFACSRAVIASDKVGCTPDLVKDGETGFEFKCGDTSDLAMKIQRLHKNRELCRMMGENARRLIDDWSVERAAASMVTLLARKACGITA